MSRFSSISITLGERISRIYSDLRVGIPIIIHAEESYLIVPVETLNQTRFNVIRSHLEDLRLVISSRRAKTLKMSSYDKDLARIKVPSDRSLEWLRAVADPSQDLIYGIKGPFT